MRFWIDDFKLNDKREFANDGGLLGDGIRHSVGTSHGMSLLAGVSLSARLVGKPIACSAPVIINQWV